MNALESMPVVATRGVFPGAETDVRFARVVGAEWGKLWALRSTWWIIGASVLSQAGLGALVTATTSATRDGEEVAAFDAARFPVVGLQLVQLVVVVLAVLAVTSEHATGLARTTFLAVPSRLPVLWAKVVVVVTTGVLATVVGGGLSIVTGLAAGGERYGFALDGAQTVRLLVSGPLYMAGIAALAVGVAAMVRNTAGALGALFGMLLVVENVFAGLSVPILEKISPFLPGTAGLQLTIADDDLAMMHESAGGAVLAPWTGFAVLLTWAVVCLGGAAVLMRRRDV